MSVVPLHSCTNTGNYIITVTYTFNNKFPDTIAAESGIAGNVWLYRPSDKGQDIHHDFQLLNELEWTKQIGKLENGRWKVKIDWKAGSRSYFQEEEIIL